MAFKPRLLYLHPQNYHDHFQKKNIKVPSPPPHSRHTFHAYNRYCESSRSSLSYTTFMVIPHIKEIKAKCIRASNVLKFLSYSSTGCNREVLLTLYQNFMRSILDYGAPIYGLAPRHSLPSWTLFRTPPFACAQVPFE